jgi:hypothetical protein
MLGDGTVSLASQDEHLLVAAAATSIGYLLRTDYMTVSNRCIMHVALDRTSVVGSALILMTLDSGRSVHRAGPRAYVPL